MVESAYIHIPFCRQKCFYCSFVSYAMPELIDDYLKALAEEIKYYYRGEFLNTLYLGGGTPSILSSKQISKILSQFNISDNTEITIELNPENIDKKYISELKKTGINRLSIGSQTFDEKILKLIGRRHSATDVEFVVKTAQDLGFNNISLDFIYGLPEQNIENFLQDLELAKNLAIQHISLYGLKIEKGSYFYKNPPENIADEDMQADMYLGAIRALSDFEHYEISNFAKKGFYSKHNLNYWNNENYYGFGVAAHGYTQKTRYANQSAIKDYVKTPIKKFSSHTLSFQEQLEEEIFLGFRKIDGLNISKINEKFNIDFEKKYSKILSKYQKSGHIKKTNSGFSLSIEGILLSNVILSEFLD